MGGGVNHNFPQSVQDSYFYNKKSYDDNVNLAESTK